VEWNLVERIRKALSIGVDLETIHDTIMAGKNPPSEGDFYLAYKAAEILDCDGPPIAQRK
jgi:hypothetical protein